MDIRNIPINKIIVKENTRANSVREEDLTELMDSIKAIGLIQPVGVEPIKKKGKTYYVLNFGNRRYNAVKKLGLKSISSLIVNNKNPEDGLILNLVENLQRKDCDAFSYGRMMCILQEEYKLTPSELASRLSISLSKVKMYSDIFKLTPEKYRSKIKPVIGGPNAKRGNIPVQLAHRIVLLKKSMPDITKQDIELLFEYAKRDDFSHENFKVISNMLNEGYSFKDAFKKGKDITFTRLHVLLTKKDEAYLNKICKKLNMSKNQALLGLIYGDKKIKTFDRVL